MVDEFKKMGYTEEQCQELEKLSVIGNDDIADIDIHDAEKMLSDTMEKYHFDKNKTDRIIDSFNQVSNQEEVKVNSKVKSFLKMIHDGMEVNNAINKSGNGLNIPSINIDFLVFAGTKLPFIKYHTPFIHKMMQFFLKLT